VQPLRATTQCITYGANSGKSKLFLLFCRKHVLISACMSQPTVPAAVQHMCCWRTC
jgi:hypothetical protein